MGVRAVSIADPVHHVCIVQKSASDWYIIIIICIAVGLQVPIYLPSLSESINFGHKFIFVLSSLIEIKKAIAKAATSNGGISIRTVCVRYLLIFFAQVCYLLSVIWYTYVCLVCNMRAISCL